MGNDTTESRDREVIFMVGYSLFLLAVGIIIGFGFAYSGTQHVSHLQVKEPFRLHMPDAGLTPGLTLPVSAEEICVKGYSGKVRDVPQSVKEQVFARYKITSHKPGEYEVDHLISLELGGSNDIENLWPQPYQGEWNAHMKDRLENKLHKLVCEGTLTLKEAQQEISTDWVEAYEKYISN